MAPNELNMIILISAYPPTHIPVAPHIYTVHMSPSTNSHKEAQLPGSGTKRVVCGE